MPSEYEKTVWQAGDIVTAEKMNKIEDQLDYITKNGASSAEKQKTVSVELTASNWQEGA